MIRISPPDARGPRRGTVRLGFLAGSVGGPVLGSLTAEWPGRAVPHLRCGAAGGRGRGVRQPAAFGGGRARDQRRTDGVDAHRPAQPAPTSPRCSRNFATGWSSIGCGSRWFRCSSSTPWDRTRMAGWRWRRSRSATSRRWCPVAICPTGGLAPAGHRGSDGVGAVDGGGGLRCWGPCPSSWWPPM